MTSDSRTAAVAIPTAALLDHWQGHRRVTRRVIQAFPEDALFNYSIGGMRPFAAMAFEMVSMASAGVRGIATGIWDTGSGLLHHSGRPAPATRDALLALWDDTTRQIDELWPQIPPQRFEEVDTAFGAYEASSTACSCTGSTTRSTTVDRATSTYARWGSNRPRSKTEADGCVSFNRRPGGQSSLQEVF